MKNTMISMVYGAILVVLFVLTFLIAAGILVPENTLLVAAIVISLIAAIVLDMDLIKPRRRFHYALLAA